MKKTLLLASGFAMALMAENACAMVQPVQAPSYDVSEELYAGLLSLDHLSDTDEAGTQFKIQIEYDNETVTSYINPRGLALFSIGLALENDLKPQFDRLLESYYVDHPAERPFVTPEYNTPGGLLGMGKDLMMEIMHGTTSLLDLQNLFGINKETFDLKNYRLFDWATQPARERYQNLPQNISDNDFNSMLTSDFGRTNENAAQLAKVINSLRTSDGKSLLEFALDHGLTQSATSLHSLGAELPSTIPWDTYITSGKLPALEWLVENGAEVNIPDANGNTLLHKVLDESYRREYLRILEILLNHGADVNVDGRYGRSPLAIAISLGSLEAVDSLVSHGADVNRQDENSMTPMMHAARHGNLKILDYLLSHGADINGTNTWKQTPLYWAAFDLRMGVIQYLVEHHAVVDKVDNSGDTPLITALESGDATLMRRFHHGESPLRNIVTCLVEHGADVNKTTQNGTNPLYLAVATGNLEIVKYLIDHGANVDGVRGYVPLVLASARGNLPIVEYLVTHGADVNKKRTKSSIDTKPMSPLKAALRDNHPEVADFLRAHGAREDDWLDFGIGVGLKPSSKVTWKSWK